MALTKIKDYIVSPQECFFFDTNVWIFLYGLIANYEKKKQQSYSSLLSQIINRKSMIFISSLVLSEFINRNLQLEFKHWKNITGNVNADFKRDFRQTVEYSNAKKTTIDSVKEIIEVTERRPDDFNAIDIDELLNYSNDCDFNDAYIAMNCKKGKMILVTDDKDFSWSYPELKILSA